MILGFLVVRSSFRLIFGYNMLGQYSLFSFSGFTSRIPHQQKVFEHCLKGYKISSKHEPRKMTLLKQTTFFAKLLHKYILLNKIRLSLLNVLAYHSAVFN